MRNSIRTGLIIAAAGVLAGLSACGTTPTREDRVKGRQVAMRGAAYKRLIVTYTEAHQLAVRSADYVARLEAANAEPEWIYSAQLLADDAAEFADDVEWFLANRRRMQWHGTRMDELWSRYEAFDPAHERIADTYRTKDMEQPTYRWELRDQYAERYDVERHEARWGDLFAPVGAKLYPGNPWEDEVDESANEG